VTLTWPRLLSMGPPRSERPFLGDEMNAYRKTLATQHHASPRCSHRPNSRFAQAHTPADRLLTERTESTRGDRVLHCRPLDTLPANPIVSASGSDELALSAGPAERAHGVPFHVVHFVKPRSSHVGPTNSRLNFVSGIVERRLQCSAAEGLPQFLWKARRQRHLTGKSSTEAAPIGRSR
jgi:hypothetical protein